MHQIVTRSQRRDAHYFELATHFPGVARRVLTDRSRLSILIMLAAGAMIYAGLQQKFDQQISTGSLGRYVYGIAAALSDEAYGLRGYAYYEPVEAALQKAGLTDDPVILNKDGTHYPDNLRDPNLINGAIRDAARLQITIPPLERQLPEYYVRAAPGEDLGIVDLVKLSFKLFGQRIESVYRFFCAVFLASMLLFWLGFRNYLEGLKILCCVCVASTAIFASPLFTLTYSSDSTSWMTVIDPRVLTLLGFVPLLHLLAATIRPASTGLRQSLLITAQAAILFLVVQIRASAYWMLIALAVITLVALRRMSFAQIVGPARISRPLFLVAAVFLIGSLYMVARMHPLYTIGYYLPRHAFWHDVYYGLQSNPDWAPKFGPSHMIGGVPASGDAQPVAGLYRYLATHPSHPGITLHDATGSLTWGAIEHYLYYAFWDLVIQHPRFALKRYFVSKPAQLACYIWAMTRTFTTGVPKIIWIFFFGIVVSFGISVAQLEKGQWKSIFRLVGLLALCVPVSTIPNIATVVSPPVMFDTIFMVVLVSLLLAILLTAMLVRSTVSTVRKIRAARSQGFVVREEVGFRPI